MVPTYDAFLSPAAFNALQRHGRQHHHHHNLEERVSVFQMSLKDESHKDGASINNSQKNKDDEDEILLKQVSADMLKDLCRQNGLSTLGTKQDMLLRLRAYAQQQAEIDRERRRMQKERIERGVDDAQGNGKAKYRIVSKDDLEEDDDDTDGVFYFSLPGKVPDAQNKTLAKVTSTTITKTINDSRGAITAPPPPPGVKANEDGEITVTTYSSTDQNDLTGIAAHHSASSGNDRALAGGYSRSDDFGADPLRSPENTLAGGPFGDQSGAKRKKATDQQFDEACDVISELVYSLLSMTGAPGFQEQFSEGVTPFKSDEEKVEDFESQSTKNNNPSSSYSNIEFVGFDPSRVPTHLITQASAFLRIRNGEALRKVLNEAELQAIGFDGINGDDKRKGGGHYLEVTKVGTFLEGFRKAEIRRIARETITMLLDQLVTGGVKSLDQMLMTMARSSEDTGDSGELNDSLVKYLDDAIRDQEKKVEQLIGQQGILSQSKVTGNPDDDPNDVLSKLWNVTTDEDGNTVESLDPNDPRVQKAIERELQDMSQNQRMDIPTHPSKILLNMLILLKERIKAEAAFSNDEKGRNLRILAYCLHAKDDREREAIILENMGTNLDKLDSFSQLLTSSIDYAESTSHQLQPTKSGPLNIHLLKNIKELVQYLKDKQAWKASGVTTTEQNRYLPRTKN